MPCQSGKGKQIEDAMMGQNKTNLTSQMAFGLFLALMLSLSGEALAHEEESKRARQADSAFSYEDEG